MQQMSRIAALAAMFLAGSLAQAQSFCSSDGQSRPVALLERFINADCDTCWSDTAATQPGRGELAIDWIVPGSKGEDAPLSAAASRDGLGRLAQLRRTPPERHDSVRGKLSRPARNLRVAHGLPFNGYLGASIELKAADPGPWSPWLALVETIPAGTEGTPIERNLVRNVLQPAWNVRGPLSKLQQKGFLESRPMSIPEGAKPDRLRVVGWVEDARGRIVAAAQSRCAGHRDQ